MSKSRLHSKRTTSSIGQSRGWPRREAGLARRQYWLRRSRGERLQRASVDPLARDPRLAKVEAILLLAREPLPTRRLAQLAGLADGTEARTLVRRLNRLYDSSGSAFRAEEIGGGFQLMTRAKFGAWLRRLFAWPVAGRLSAPALETLAIVAYRQPVMRSEVDAVRGVDCSEILRQLMERDLVRIAGRSHELGRPYLYGTTRRFLAVFGLRNLDDLPRADQLRRHPTHGGKRQDRPESTSKPGENG